MADRLVAERVNDFIKKRKPTPVCDLCIVEGVGLGKRAHANQITAALATTIEFAREKGTCPSCERPDLMIIRAVDPKGASDLSTVLNFESMTIELGKVTVKIVR